MTRLTFLGAAGTVTGSRHLLEVDDQKILIDCGLFQGTKANRLKNWEPFPIDPKSIDKILLTHAHIDHIGFLPKVVKNGYNGPIYGTNATVDLAQILLPDTGHLQEEEARWANKKGYSKHRPAQPLFTEKDAENVFPLLNGIPYGTHLDISPTVRAKFRDTGHILGASLIDIKSTRLKRARKIVFSGDLGRPFDSILRAPSQPYNVDYLVMESTYGDRLHPNENPIDDLCETINESIRKEGVIVIPSFSVGRTQTILYVLNQLEKQGRIPPIPVYVDSPMSVEALRVHQTHLADLNLQCRKETISGDQIFHPKNLHLSVTREQSMAINQIEKNAIIISASGMATGGRILHHLQHRLPHKRNTVVLIGYQAEGTRGRSLLEGKSELKLFGEYVPVIADVKSISGFSGHADYHELLGWLMGFNRPPERIFLVHGEESQSHALASKIKKHFGWDVTVPKEGDQILLDL